MYFAIFIYTKDHYYGKACSTNFRDSELSVSGNTISKLTIKSPNFVASLVCDKPTFKESMVR